MRLRPLAGSILFCLTLFVGKPSPASAQVSAVISGLVTDESGAAVSAATVSARNVETGAQRAVATDNGGRYRIAALPVGQYELGVKKDGFQQALRSGLHLAVDQEATVDFTFMVGGVQQRITVTEEAPAVSTTTTDISGMVAEQQIKDLPLNGRSYDELLTLNPGIVNFTSQKTGGVGISNSTV